jgi:hypothetical protein
MTPRDETIVDERDVPSYTLPDPLTFADGTPVSSADDWLSLRRPELLARFEHHVYGRAPGRPEGLAFEVESEVDDALNGKARRKEVTVHLSDRADGPKMHILIYLPYAVEGPVPLFVGLNFSGNHTIQPDPGITLSTQWMRAKPDAGIQDHRATEASRGATGSRRSTAATSIPTTTTASTTASTPSFQGTTGAGMRGAPSRRGRGG